MSDKLIIGSHVSMSGPSYYEGSVKEALSYGANAFMIYTGAPQNSLRKATSELKIEEGRKLIEENNIDPNNIVVHAPYIINLGNSVKQRTYDLAVSFLKDELVRVSDFKIKTLILHPGSHVGEGVEVGMKQIIEGLNEVFKEDKTDVNLILDDDFLTYPFYCRSGYYDTKGYVFLAKSKMNLKGFFDYPVLLEKVVKNELAENSDIFIRVYVDEDGYYLIGYITKEELLTNPEIKKMVKPGKSQNALYFAKPLREGKPMNTLSSEFE